MTSPVSAIEAIEKALDEFDREVQEQLSAESERAGLWEELDVNASDLREVLALARQAEALQRENAEKDARIALLRESLLGFEHACEQLAATRSLEIYTAMIDGGQAREFLELDNARRRARALLGGSENAE